MIFIFPFLIHYYLCLIFLPDFFHKLVQLPLGTFENIRTERKGKIISEIF